MWRKGVGPPPRGATNIVASDRWVDDHKQFGVTLSYRLNPHWELYADGLNLTNEPFRVYFGKHGTRLVQFEEYGVSANFGVRWRLERHKFHNGSAAWRSLAVVWIAADPQQE